jgi:acetyl/propionyl-CoA carboxylase alpha subunit
VTVFEGATLKRVLIANRGEIAVRIARACSLLGIESIAVYSEADATARHVRVSDRSVSIGPSDPVASYLSDEAILEAAKRTGADAVHPGYGFLSESPEFARAVTDAGLVWIGPPADVIIPLKSKTDAKRLAEAAGVPTAPSQVLDDISPEAVARAAEAIGYPLLVKPEHGGGGKGMQRVDREQDLQEAVTAARRIAAGAFASDNIFLERWIDGARHVEVQVLADDHGDVVHLFERECSLQRRHQKVIEESPCAVLSEEERRAICDSGQAFAKGIGYVGAGTVEFLFDPVRREHHFLEMNTRLQVEHPVTEMVVGVDLVVAQLRIARGESLQSMAAIAGGLRQRGHAIEARVYAEDPANGYMPQTGRLHRLRWPDAPFVRVDAGVEQGDEVSMHYDPMLAKIIAWGADRGEALDRLAAALHDTVIHGVTTNIPLMLDVLARDDMRAYVFDTGSLSSWYGAQGPGLDGALDQAAVVGLALAGPGGPRSAAVAARNSADDRRVVKEHDPWQRLTGWRQGRREDV